MKNATLTWRNKPAAILQFLAIFIFILLIYGVATAIELQNRSQARYQDVIAPAPYAVGGIPDCTASSYMNKDCYTLLWAPNTDPVATSVAANIAANNNPPIPASRIKSFVSADAANAWMQTDGNFGKSLGVIEFFSNAQVESIDFGIQIVRAASFAPPRRLLRAHAPLSARRMQPPRSSVATSRATSSWRCCRCRWPPSARLRATSAPSPPARRWCSAAR